MMGLKDKVVAITGASSGIGEATALLLAERGAKVVLGARRGDRLADVTQPAMIRFPAGQKAGGTAVCQETDVRRRDDLKALVATAVDRFGRLDVLVGCAGVGLTSPMDDLRVDDWEEIIDVNLKGALYGIAAALPAFRAQGSGQFVTVLSTAGLRIVPTQGVYAGSKNAVRTILEALRQEAGPTLRVTSVSPGFVATDFATHVADERLKAEVLAMRDRIAIPPEAIARAIAFAIEQPADVEIGEIVVRPTAQG